MSGFRVRSQLALLAARNDSLLLTASLPRSRGAEAPGVWVFPAPSFRKEGARNAGRPMRPQPRVQSCRKHTSTVTTKAPKTSGVPHAMVCRLASCSPRQRSEPVRRRLRRFPTPPGFGQRRQQTGLRSGPHDLGRRARRYEWGASPPRSAPHSVVVHRDVRPHTIPVSKRPLWAPSLLPGRALASAPRRDAAASTASRPADRDDRETPLSMGRDVGRYMILWE
jgi:hypothetical protein